MKNHKNNLMIFILILVEINQFESHTGKHNPLESMNKK